MSKKGFVELSFGMIFSIILIIIFIAFAFYGISKFLEIRDATLSASFFNDLQNDADELWQSSQGSAMKTYNLPTEVKFVCFVDYTIPSNTNDEIYEKLKFAYSQKENVFLYPLGENINSKEIEHLNLDKITGNENPFCIESKGKVSVVIKKYYGESLVRIEKPI